MWCALRVMLLYNNFVYLLGCIHKVIRDIQWDSLYTGRGCRSSPDLLHQRTLTWFSVFDVFRDISDFYCISGQWRTHVS